VDEFFFDGFAFGVVADDAAAAVAFEEEDLKLLLQAALTVDAIGLLHRMLLSGLLAVLSVGSWAGSFRGRFRGHVGLSFFGIRGPQDAGAGVVKWEIVRFVVRRLAPADFRSVAYLNLPIRLLASGANWPDRG
jgi:hypothetical protein